MCIAETSTKPSRTPLACTCCVDLVGDVDDLLAALGLEPEVVGVGGHRSASSSSSRTAVSVFSSRYFTITGV